MPKKQEFNYVVIGRRYPTFRDAACAAVYSAVRTRKEVAISECKESGEVVGYINIRATAEDLET